MTAVALAERCRCGGRTFYRDEYRERVCLYCGCVAYTAPVRIEQPSVRRVAQVTRREQALSLLAGGERSAREIAAATDIHWLKVPRLLRPLVVRGQVAREQRDDGMHYWLTGEAS